MSWTNAILALCALAGAPPHVGAASGASSLLSVTLARARGYTRLRRKASSAS